MITLKTWANALQNNCVKLVPIIASCKIFTHPSYMDGDGPFSLVCLMDRYKWLRPISTCSMCAVMTHTLDMTSLSMFHDEASVGHFRS